MEHQSEPREAMDLSAEPGRAIGASFRDPAGFIFFHQGAPYRQICEIGREDYEFLISSGLYDELTQAGLLVKHQEAPIGLGPAPNAWKVIQPEQVPFISYPYEWCFGQLKDAALATLEIQRRAIAKGMWLKDASAFNIQFINNKPVLIDTLSLARLPGGSPWIAYRQFCQHFLSPLALISHQDWRLGRLMRLNLDGIPLDLAARLIPGRKFMMPSLMIHLKLHAKSQMHFGGRKINIKKSNFSPQAMIGLLDSLQGTVKKLKWDPQGTQWAEYYDDTNYCEKATKHKQESVCEFLDILRPKSVWDLGANDGRYSELAASRAKQVISFDMDMAAVEQNYRRCRRHNFPNILPLVMDLSNPSPAVGWALKERDSLMERGPADTLLALALVHHLVVGNNLPYGAVAKFFSRITNNLIIEYVPPEDSQVKRLMVSRDFSGVHDLGCEAFKEAFGSHFIFEQAKPLNDSARVLYLMRSKK